MPFIKMTSFSSSAADNDDDDDAAATSFDYSGMAPRSLAGNDTQKVGGQSTYISVADRSLPTASRPLDVGWRMASYVACRMEAALPHFPGNAPSQRIQTQGRTLYGSKGSVPSPPMMKGRLFCRCSKGREERGTPATPAMMELFCESVLSAVHRERMADKVSTIVGRSHRKLHFDLCLFS